MFIHILEIWAVQHPSAWKFLKFSTVNLVFGYIGNLFLVVFFDRVLNLWYGYGMFLGALIIHLIKYALNDAWTWGR